MPIPRRFPLSQTEAGTLLAIGLILLYRFPERLLSPQLWAEDGAIFLQQQRDLGITSLWMPYAGYLHVVLRLLALAIGSVTDLLYLPAIYNGTALLFTVLTGWFILRSRVDIPYKPAIALALVLVPHLSEVYMTLTNLQWIFATALPLFVLQTPAPTRLRKIVDTIGVLLFGMTGPFLLIFSPLLLYRFWRDGWKSRSNIAFCLTGLVAVGVQAYCVSHTPAPPPAVISAGEWLVTNGAMLIGGLLLGRTVAHSLFSDNIGAYIHHLRETLSPPMVTTLFTTVAFFVIAGGVGVILGLLRLPRTRRDLAFALLICAFAVFAAAMRRLQSDFEPIGPFTNGTRYFFIPYVFLTWVFILLTTAGGFFRQVGLGLLLLVLLSTMSVLGPPPTTANRHWASYVKRYKQGESVVVPIPPDGEAGTPWHVNLTRTR